MGNGSNDQNLTTLIWWAGGWGGGQTLGALCRLIDLGSTLIGGSSHHRFGTLFKLISRIDCGIYLLMSDMLDWPEYTGCFF